MTRILAYAAHPDDETLGAGGTIARHAADGDHVSLVIVTRAYPPDWDEDLITRKREEVKRAAAILGVADLRFLDMPAARLDTVPHHELNAALGQVVSEQEPEVVYTPHYGDIHLDHRALFDSLMVATRPMPGTSVRGVLAYEVLSSSEWSAPTAAMAFLPNVYCDISGHLDTKVEALLAYESEVRDAPHPRSEAIVRALAAKRGSEVGLEAAEAFQLIRDIR